MEPPHVRLAQQIPPVRKQKRRFQQEIEKIREPLPLQPKRSDQHENCTRRRPELRQNLWNQSKWWKGISKKRIPRLEHGISTRSHGIRHRSKINTTAVIQRGYKKVHCHQPPLLQPVEDLLVQNPLRPYHLIGARQSVGYHIVPTGNKLGRMMISASAQRSICCDTPLRTGENVPPCLRRYDTAVVLLGNTTTTCRQRRS